MKNRVTHSQQWEKEEHTVKLGQNRGTHGHHYKVGEQIVSLAKVEDQTVSNGK